MATGYGISEILAAAAATASSTLQIVGAASPLSSGALRTLTHTDATNFPVVTYNRNPDRTINFDTVPLRVPSSVLTKTLGTTLAQVNQNSDDDVLVTEVWTGNDRRASMVTAMFRRLFELIINPPAITDPLTYVQWAPADRTADVYNVVLTGLRVGSGDRQLDVRDVGVDQCIGLDAVSTGMMDRTVALDLLIVSKV